MHWSYSGASKFFVLYSEVVLWWEVGIVVIFKCAIASVLYIEVVLW